MGKVSAEDLSTIFLGSGALTYPWYTRVDIGDTQDGGWELTFAEYDIAQAVEGVVGEHTVSDLDIMRTVRMIASKEGESIPFLGKHTRKECQALVSKGADDVDFDSDMADQVIQVSAFGKVVYG